MCGLEHGHRVRQVGARRDADAADLRGQRVGNVVAVEVEGGDHAVLGRAQQDLLQEGIGDAVLDDDVLARLGILELAPGSAVNELGTELLLRQGIGPVTEATFGELHDVALVHDGDAGLVVVDGVLNGLANQPLRALARYGLDTDAGGLGEADLLDTHFLDQEVDDLLGLVGLGFVFDAGIDVLRVLAEDHHIGLVRLLDRAGHAGEVLHRAQAHIQIKLLAQGHVERTDATAHGRGQRPLDGDHIVTHRVQGFLRQPDIGAVHLGGLLAGVHLHPVDLLLATVGLGHGRVDDLDHHRCDVQARTVTLDIGNDGVVGYVEREIGVDGDLGASGGHLDVLVHVRPAPVCCNGAHILCMRPAPS